MARVLLVLAGPAALSAVMPGAPAFAQASGSGGSGGNHAFVKPKSGGAGATSQDPAYGGGGGGGGGKGASSASQATGGAGGSNGSHLNGGGGGSPGVIGFDGRTSGLAFDAGSWIGTAGSAGGAGQTGPNNTTDPLANGVDGSSGGGGGGGGAGAFLPASGSVYSTGIGVTIQGGNGGIGGVGGSGGYTSAVGYGGGFGAGGGGGGGGAAGILLEGGNLNVGAHSEIAGGNGGRGGDGGSGADGGPGGIVQVCSDTCHVYSVNGGEQGIGGGGGAGGSGGVGIFAGPSSIVTLDTNVRVRGGIGGDGGIGGQTGANGESGLVDGTPSGNGGNGGNGGIGVYLGAGSTLHVGAGSIVSGGNSGRGGISLYNSNDSSSVPGATGSNGQAGVGVYSVSGGTIVNDGTIEGGLNPDGSRANAITFAGGSSRLELWGGSVITGNVVANGGGPNTLALGGGQNAAFNLSMLGSQYQGFNQFEKTGTSTWFVSGETASTFDSVRVDGGTMALTSNSRLKSTDAVIGGAAGSNGAVTLDGARWFNWNPMIIGDQGTGSLTISNGGALVGMIDFVPVFGSVIGNQAGSHGNIVITGAGSSWTNLSALTIGQFGSGSLTISNGGRLDSYSLVAIGAGPGSIGAVTVTGAGSYWNTHLVPENSPDNALGIGNYGSGSLTISDGGKVDSGMTVLLNANVLVTGHGSVLNTSNFDNMRSLFLSSDATHSAVLTIADGGVVNTGGDPTEIRGAASALNIGAAPGDAATAPGTLTTDTIQFTEGGTLNFNHTATDYAFGAAMSGAGAINFLAGTTILTGNSSGFNGSTTVSGSTLKMVSTGSLGGTLAVNNGGRLEGSGAVGTTIVNSGGSLAPSGAQPLTVTGNLTVNGGGSVVSDKGMLKVDGSMTLNAASAFNYSFGAAAIGIRGDLALDGATLNIANDGTPRFGTYSLMTYDGSLTNNNLSIGSTPSTSPLAYAYALDMSTVHAINLVAIPNGVNIFQKWGGSNDGTGMGSGTWNAANANWLDPIGGSVPTTWGSGYGMFSGPGGTVTVQGAQSAVGLEFTRGDYTLVACAGGALQLHRYVSPDFTIDVPELRVLPGITATISATIEGVDGVRKSGDGTLILSGTSTYTGGTIVSGGTLQISSDANLGDSHGGLTFDTRFGTLRTTQTMSSARTINVLDTAIFDTATGTTFNVTGNITGAGGVIKSGDGTFALSGTNGWLGGTLLVAGMLRADAAGALPGNTDYAIVGGTLDLNGHDLSMRSLAGTGGRIGLGTAQLTVDQASDSFFAGTISGSGGLTKNGAGTLLLSGTNTYGGGTTITGGTLAISSDANLGSAGGGIALTGGTLATLADITTNRQIGVNVSGTIYAWAGSTLIATNGISGAGDLIKDGGGTLVLTGNSSLTGATTVNNGTLMVNGSLASSPVIVNAGATLSGTGIVGSTLMNGGMLAPGNPVGLLTVQGNLVMTAAATYMMQVSLANDLVHVTGTADLGGSTVNATFQEGAYVARRYLILTADGGLNASTFGRLAVTGVPASFTSSLSYDASNVYLQLAMTIPSNLNINQQNVSNALVNAFNSDGGIPLVFAGLSPSALTEVSGELATGVQQSSVNAANLFLGMMSDPFVVGRSSDPSQFFSSDAGAYAPTASRRLTARDAFAAIDGKMERMSFDRRWGGGHPVSAARRTPAAIRLSDRMLRPATSMARSSARIIGCHPTR